MTKDHRRARPTWRGGSAGRGERSGAAGGRSEDADRAVLYGFHPVAEALANPRRQVLEFLATENGAGRLAAERPGLAVQPRIVRAEEISRLVEPDAVHQGLYLACGPLEPLDLDSLGPDALVLALDQVTDPHNVGAITRTAAAFGIDALLTTQRHSPSATGVLAKAASGGLEHVPLVSVRNLADALIELGARGFRRIGLDSAGDIPIGQVPPARPSVVVVGSRGPGSAPAHARLLRRGGEARHAGADQEPQRVERRRDRTLRAVSARSARAPVTTLSETG